MPYISTERVKEIRNEIKKAFPDYKFSVIRNHHSEVQISLMESDLDFEGHENVNHFYIDRDYEGRKREVLQKIADIAENGNKTITVDADYGAIPKHYVTIQVGQWNKPYKQVLPA